MGVILVVNRLVFFAPGIPHTHGGNSWIEPVYINADSVLPILMGVITSRLSMAE